MFVAKIIKCTRNNFEKRLLFWHKFPNTWFSIFYKNCSNDFDNTYVKNWSYANKAINIYITNGFIPTFVSPEFKF